MVVVDDVVDEGAVVDDESTVVSEQATTRSSIAVPNQSHRRMGRA
jgi:hypothetical protein